MCSPSARELSNKVWRAGQVCLSRPVWQLLGEADTGMSLLCGPPLQARPAQGQGADSLMQ